MSGTRHTPSVRLFSLIFCIECPIAWISSSLVLYWVAHSGSFTWQRDHNCMDPYRVSTVDVSESPIASGNDSSSGVTPCMKNDGVLYHYVLHAVPENILGYYNLMPLQF